VAKILVADDNIEIQELLNFILTEEGHELIIASDGEEALEKAIKENPDLILLDIMLPRMSGYEICEKLKNNPTTASIPIIILTSLTQTKDRITGIKLGADEYVCKPFEPYELVARIEALLKRAKTSISVNPLTGLPGNIRVEEEIKNRLNSGQQFAIFYIDIDNFGPVNEKYGFEKGNSIIIMLSKILKQCLSSIEENGFVGHLSDEDFVLIVSPYNIDELARKIIELFNNEIINCYDEEVKKMGFFYISDRDGKEKKVPVATLSIGIGIISPEKYSHPLSVINYAKDMWRIAKSQPENSYVIG
jgi:diguanylate cyclase (GGDEF)-like protein